MVENKQILFNDQELGNLTQEDAAVTMQEAFELDPVLKVQTQILTHGDLFVKYTNTSKYREGDLVKLSIYNTPINNQILITQEYPIDRHDNSRPFRLFLKEVDKLEDRDNIPYNWHEEQGPVWNSSNLVNRVKGSVERVNDSLLDVVKYERILLLYQKFFLNSNNCGIPQNRLNIHEMDKDSIEHHVRALIMAKSILKNPESIKYYNYGNKGVYGYDNDQYIACAVLI
jgi:hypothetical protein